MKHHRVPKYFNQENLDLFWRFVAERQKVYWRRTVKRKPFPWTKDKILLEQFFTNVYRYRDPGTTFVVETILNSKRTRGEKLFAIMVYRYMGSQQELFEWTGDLPFKHYNWKKFAKGVEAYRDQGGLPFGNAYTVSPFGNKGDKITFVAKLFDAWGLDMDRMMKKIDRAPDSQTAFKFIGHAMGMGPFLSWQVLVDCLYKNDQGEALLPFSENDWVAAGPGAKRGVDHMMKDPDTKKKPAEIIKWLQSHQKREFKRLEIDFKWDPELGKLSLADIQNCCCEFSKYMKFYLGNTKGRTRKYRHG